MKNNAVIFKAPRVMKYITKFNFKDSLSILINLNLNYIKNIIIIEKKHKLKLESLVLRGNIYSDICTRLRHGDSLDMHTCLIALIRIVNNFITQYET